MADDLDALLQSEDQNLSSDSQSDNQNDGSNSDTQLDGTEGLTPEEVEFNQLSGSAQDRFRRILQERNQYKQQIGGQVPPPPIQTTGTDPLQNPQVKEAVGRLKEVGIATRDDVKQEIQNVLGQWQFGAELTRLEHAYSGDDGKPKFTREEYEDYVQRYPQYRDYLPEDVYEKMYREELDDWRVSGKGQGKPSQTRSQSLRPTRTATRDQEITPESIEETLRSLPESERQAYYEKNIDKINKALGRLSR